MVGRYAWSQRNNQDSMLRGRTGFFETEIREW
jgi:hypothetical protein